MSSQAIITTLIIENMTCAHCETTIEHALAGIEGIIDVKAHYSSGKVEITYRPDKITLEQIEKLIEEQDYYVKREKKSSSQKSTDITNVVGILIIAFTIYMIGKRFGLMNIFNLFPTAKEGMGYGMLFIIGLLTSLHCVAMCGGICITQCAVREDTMQVNSSKLSALKPSLLYNLGRVISYTVIGGLVGAIGSVISFSGVMKGFVQILAGIFMVVMGLNMLQVFPWLRKLNPRMPKIFAKLIYRQKSQNSNPLIIGLLNGLMPCGPLQAIQIYALSTGDPLKGAVSMFLFSVGTFPLMFAFGAFSSFLTKRFHGGMLKVSAGLVLILGVFMLSNGAALSGLTLAVFPTEKVTEHASNMATIKDGVQTVTTGLSPGSYEPIIVQKGIPVVWIIQAKAGDLNGCNNSIVVPQFDIQQDLSEGDTVIEFMPTSSGSYPFSCWMGMIRSSITVVDDISTMK